MGKHGDGPGELGLRIAGVIINFTNKSRWEVWIETSVLSKDLLLHVLS